MDMNELEKHVVNCPKYADPRVIFDPLIHTCPLSKIDDGNLVCFNCVKEMRKTDSKSEYYCTRCDLGLCSACVLKCPEKPYQVRKLLSFHHKHKLKEQLVP